MKIHKKKENRLEKIQQKICYASVVAIKNIAKNSKFSLNNIWVKRPGTRRLLAKDLKKKILGKISKKH